MTVLVIRQAKVTDVVRRVVGLHHRAQQHAVDANGIGSVFGGFDDTLIIGLRWALFWEAQTKVFGVLMDTHGFFAIWPIVVTIQDRQLMLESKVCRTSIGQ